MLKIHSGIWTSARQTHTEQLSASRRLGIRPVFLISPLHHYSNHGWYFFFKIRAAKLIHRMEFSQHRRVQLPFSHIRAPCATRGHARTHAHTHASSCSIYHQCDVHQGWPPLLMLALPPPPPPPLINWWFGGWGTASTDNISLHLHLQTHCLATSRLRSSRAEVHYLLSGRLLT